MKNPLKITPVILALLASTAPAFSGQPPAGISRTAASKVLSESGPHHRSWTVTYTNPPAAAGLKPRLEQHRVSEIGTGMQYWDGQQWAASNPSFDVSAAGDAFVADRLHYKVRLAADNLNAAGSIAVTTPDGLVLKSTPVAIGLYDKASGQSLILAGVTNCPGVLVNSNRVLYADAFNANGVRASVVCTAERGSFSADIVLTSRIDPADYGFPAKTTRIQMFTEYYDAPQPHKIRTAIRVEKDPKLRQSMASPDLIDETLGFGEVVIGRGRVYAMSARTNRASAVVAKEFKTVDQRTFLIESVEYPAIRKGLLALSESKTGKGLLRQKGNGKSRYAALPKAGLAGQRPSASKRTKIELASIRAVKLEGLCIDPELTLNNMNTPEIFQGDTTYFVSAPVFCNGSVTIEGGAVFKYPNSSGSDAQGHATTAYIQFNNQVTMATSSYRPAVFTAGDDDSVGASMANVWDGYTGNIIGACYASPALLAPNYLALSYCRFSYATVAFECDVYDVGQVLVDHSQFVNCFQGFSIVDYSGGSGSGSGSGLQVSFYDCLMANLSYLLDGSYDPEGSGIPLYLTHCTIANTMLTPGSRCYIQVSSEWQLVKAA